MNIKKSLQIAAVFIGTVVGAGLASGREIMIFFTQYGYKSFIGMILVMFIYIFVAKTIINISLEHNLKSYNDLIQLISPNLFGSVITLLLSSLFLCSASIILAGSGALLNEFFGIPKWIGLLIMLIVTVVITLRKTKGLIEVNSFIVPALTTVIILIFVLYLIKPGDNFNLNYIISIDPEGPNYWLFKSINYGCFNIFASCGVLIPLTFELKDERSLNMGMTIGAIVLTILSLILNFMLIINVPDIFYKEIPLLYVTGTFSRYIQTALLIIIWLEMYSTEVSDIFTLSRALEKSFKISYNHAIFLILGTAFAISQFGFANLVNFLYPAFAILSTIFVILILYFRYFKSAKLKNLKYKQAR